MDHEFPSFLIGLLLCAILCAFAPNTAVTSDEWAFASKSCQNNGGVKYTRGQGSIRAQQVVCVNGAEFGRTKNEETNDGR